MAQFTNQASITYNGIVANSNIVTGEVTQVLTVWKDATVSEYMAGDILTYVISIQNSGPTALSGLTVTDDLGAYTYEGGTAVPLTFTGEPILYYINGILQAAPTATAGPPLEITGISVPAGLSSLLVYRARVNDFAPLGTGESIENTVTVSGDLLNDSVTATETVANDTAASLSIIKAVNPTTVVESGRLSYTFTITNTGASPADADARLIISDNFTPILDAPLSVTLDGTAWTQVGNYSYNTATGEFETIAGRVTVPAATFVQNAATGLWTVTPGVTVLTVTSTI